MYRAVRCFADRLQSHKRQHIMQQIPIHRSQTSHLTGHHRHITSTNQSHPISGAQGEVLRQQHTFKTCQSDIIPSTLINYQLCIRSTHIHISLFSVRKKTLNLWSSKFVEVEGWTHSFDDESRNVTVKAKPLNARKVSPNYHHLASCSLVVSHRLSALVRYSSGSKGQWWHNSHCSSGGSSGGDADISALCSRRSLAAGFGCGVHGRSPRP